MLKQRRHLGWWSGLIILPCLAWASMQMWTKANQTRLCAKDYAPPPPGMVFVPAGEFWMGSDDPTAEPDEKPLRKVFLPAFYIDRFEVTNRRYQEFKKDHRYAPGEDELPVTFVRKAEAEAFARWAGRRLPTGAEWEKAARGTDGRAYPWGNVFSADRANIDRRVNLFATNAAGCQLPGRGGAKGKLPGGTFPGGASPYGCQDMAGNVWEWVSDVWVDRDWVGHRSDNDVRGILRGGAYSYSPRQAHAAYQAFEALGATCHDVGFRCAKEAREKRKAESGKRKADSG